MSKAQEGYECEYQVQNEMLNDAKKLFVEAELSDSEREEKIKEIAKEIMKASVETSDIEIFLRIR
jgi:flagellar biosynthesis protein FliP